MSDWLQQLRHLGPPVRFRGGVRDHQRWDQDWPTWEVNNDPLFEPMVAVIEAAEAVGQYARAVDLQAAAVQGGAPNLWDALSALERAVTEQT